ncbi:MFS transporter [Leuconostoc fallax]|nr:MFS transporter [Leuconostoc fallax]MBU7456416.1 MFS transporter [Leuconostoc fallax]
MMPHERLSIYKISDVNQEIDEPHVLSKDIILLMMINFLVMTAVTTQIGTLPLYVTRLGGNAAMSGLVVGIWGLAALGARIPVGKWIDRYGRKQLILIGLVILMIDFSTLIFMSTLMSLIALRAIQGIGNGTQSTAVATLVADKLPQKKLSIGLGYFSISQTLPAAIGPAIGLLIIENWGFQALFYFSLSLVSVAFLLTLFVKDTYHKDSKILPTTQLTTGFKDLIRMPSVWVPSLLIFIVCFANAAVAAFLIQFGEQKQLSPTIVGLSFTVQAIVGALARVYFAKLYFYFKSFVLIVAGIIMVAMAYLSIAFGESVMLLLLAGALNGFGLALLMPLMNAVVLRKVTLAERGRATAIFSSGMDVAYGLGALVWGIVVSFFGFQGMYICTALVVVTTLGLVWWHRRLLSE